MEYNILTVISGLICSVGFLIASVIALHIAVLDLQRIVRHHNTRLDHTENKDARSH